MSVSFSPDDSTLAVGTLKDEPRDPHRSQIRLYEAKSGRLRDSADVQGFATWTRFSPDGRTLLVRSMGTLEGADFGRYQLWDLDPLRPRGVPLAIPAQNPGAVAFLPGDRLLTKGPGGVWEWDVRAGKPLRLVIPEARGLAALVADPSARWLALLGDDGRGRLHDAATFAPVGPPLVAEGPLQALAFSRDGASILGAGEGLIVRSWPLPEPGPEPGPEETSDALALATGATLDPSIGSVVPMAASSWAERDRLAPVPDPEESPERAARRHALALDSAEAEGLTFAALWHLDRLAPLRPGDWAVEARRATALERDGRRDEAEAALDRAARIAPSEALSDWERTRAAEARGRAVRGRRPGISTASWPAIRAIGGPWPRGRRSAARPGGSTTATTTWSGPPASGWTSPGWAARPTGSSRPGGGAAPRGSWRSSRAGARGAPDLHLSPGRRLPDGRRPPGLSRGLRPDPRRGPRPRGDDARQPSRLRLRPGPGRGGR